MRNLLLYFLVFSIVSCGQENKSADRDEIEPIQVANSAPLNTNVKAVEHFQVQGDLRVEDRSLLEPKPFDKLTESVQAKLTKEGKLIQDFKLMNHKNSTHVLNAISPAFTASFALADLIIEKSLLNI